MAVFSGPLQSLIDELGRLPGVGPKSAQRITFHLLKVAPEDALRLAEAIIAVKERITLCTPLLQRGRGRRLVRDLPRRPAGRDSVCVVEDPRDIVVGREDRRVHRAGTTCSRGPSTRSRASVPSSSGSGSCWSGSRRKASPR